MARGGAGDDPARAMELTKWFDTNYHYLVPELPADQTFRLASDKPFAELAEAGRRPPGQAGAARTDHLPALGKMADGDHAASPLSLLDPLLPVYAESSSASRPAARSGSSSTSRFWSRDLSPVELAAVEHAPTPSLAAAKGAAKLLLQTAYGHVGDAYPTLPALPVDGIGLDFVRGPENLDFITQHGFPG